MTQWEFNIEETHFNIDGRQTPFLCGEIHYFRMPPESWEKALDLLVEAGCNAVAYYVPWFVHEYEEGKFDFDGHIHPQNDLHAWIRLTMEKGLLGYVRPGPYVYAETTDLGIPRWFTKKYPDAIIKHRRSGTYQDTDFANCPAHNHPDFLAAVTRWYDAVCREISGYQAPQGNIVMFQLCNEIPGDDYDDENPVNLGMGDSNGIWPAFLQKSYKTADQLNTAYGTEFLAFEEAWPHLLKKKNALLYRQDQLAYYYGTYYPAYFRRLKEITDANGIRVHLTHNAYNPRAVSLHYQNKQQNPWLLVGLDCYYSLSGRLGMKDAAYYCEFGAEYAKNFLHNVPWVVEQESGYWNDFPAVYGPELYIFNIWTMVNGYQGMNMYMFAGGENRSGMGFYGTYHGWQAPVDMNGKKTDTYEEIKRSLTDIREHQEILLKPLAYDIALGISHRPGLIWETLSKISSDAYFVLKSAGFTPEICDYEALSLEELSTYPVLYIVSDHRMEREVQKRLADYVSGGGTLILQGRVPIESAVGASCTLLADALGVTADRQLFAEDVQKKLVQDGREYWIGTKIQTIRTKQAKALAYDETHIPCVHLIEAGLGKALLLPFAMELAFFDQAGLVRSLLLQAGAKPMLSGTKMLRAVPKCDGELVVLNLHPVAVTEKIQYQQKGKTAAVEVSLQPHSFCIMTKRQDIENRYFTDRSSDDL